MKTISIFLALINSLFAGLILAFSLSPTILIHRDVWWSLMKVSVASSVILVGVLTWLGSARPLRPGLLGLCSLYLVALGAATVVWTFHLALVSGDLEFYFVIFGGSLAIQGITSLFGFAGDSKSITSL